jgi:hypothetical protein
MIGRRRLSAGIAIGVGLVFIGFAFFRLKLLPQGHDQRIATPVPIVHYANRPELPITRIYITALYFIPADRTSLQKSQWKEALDAALVQGMRFYRQQLPGLPEATINIHPEPVIGKDEHLVYDSLQTDGGNPHALLAIRQELQKRFNGYFVKPGPGEMRLVAVLYEGVGASATLMGPADGSAFQGDAVMQTAEETPMFLVSSSYLLSPVYTDYGYTIFTHELGHMWGLSDHYDIATGHPESLDIMGAGRFRRLDVAFLDATAKASMGVRVK